MPPDVRPDRRFAATYHRYETTPRPEMLPDKMALVLPIHPRQVDRDLRFDVTHYLRRRDYWLPGIAGRSPFLRARLLDTDWGPCLRRLLTLTLLLSFETSDRRASLPRTVSSLRKAPRTSIGRSVPSSAGAVMAPTGILPILNGMERDGMSMWCRLQESNPRPDDYKSTALPTELSRHGNRGRIVARSPG